MHFAAKSFVFYTNTTRIPSFFPSHKSICNGKERNGPIVFRVVTVCHSNNQTWMTYYYKDRGRSSMMAFHSCPCDRWYWSLMAGLGSMSEEKNKANLRLFKNPAGVLLLVLLVEGRARLDSRNKTESLSKVFRRPFFPRIFMVFQKYFAGFIQDFF